MTWLDVGNGWRNLYLLSMALQMAALGLWFAKKRWFCRYSRLACALTGAAAAPLCQFVWMLLMALVWPTAPRQVLIGAPPAGAAVMLLWLALSHVQRLPEVWARGKDWLMRLCHLDKPAVAALCFALCIVILLLPVCVRFMSSMDSVQGGDTGEYLALAQRYCEDRSLKNLLEKEETVGHFRGHSHFPSMELFMSYGLMHTGGQVGYPHDKAVFTALGMNTLCMLMAYVALLCVLCRGRKRWVLLGVVLFNLVPDLFFSVQSAPRDIWRILALLWAVLFFAGFTPGKGWKQYLCRLCLCFAVCFVAMSTHVVSFVVLPFIVVAWVVWRFACARMTAHGGALREGLKSVGLALSGAAGTLLAFSGNLWCYWRWGELSPWRLMTTFTTAPWYDMYMDIEYKLDETTTHVSIFEDVGSVVQAHATPIGTWGLWLGLLAIAAGLLYIVYTRRGMRRHARVTPVMHTLLFAGLVTLLTLAPMTGVLDSPLYSFSGAFLKLPRYTLQWFLLSAVMICALLSALEALWPRMLSALRLCLRRLTPDTWDALRPARRALLRLPAYLCVLLCVLGMVKGTSQTGYTNTFYRFSRDVMEDERLLLDNGFRERYGLLMDVAATIPEDKKLLITRSGYQYALRGQGYLLLSNPIVPLLNLPADEVEAALRELNVAALATEPDFWDERYFPLSGLGEYLAGLPEDRVVETPSMRVYLLDAT